MEVLDHHDVEIQQEEDIVRVRRLVRDLAEQQGLDPFATAAVTTATSELARNVWVHGGGGEARVECIRSVDRVGLRVRFSDRGPGIADVEEALHGGRSTVGSLGLGLSGSSRLVDALDIDTAPGRGTCITIIKWKRTF